jgi:hypothetical protein
MSALANRVPVGNAKPEYSIIAVDRFIQSTRDSGYKTTASAIAELVDNSIQAGAKLVDIRVREHGNDFVIAVADNGSGMDANTLREALRFGGSTRFNDRSGLGRYGMGLPNASVSQARRVNVYSWRGNSKSISSYLDVDEIAAGTLREIPEPERRDAPEWTARLPGKSGTVVVLERCDRIDHRRVSTVCRKLHENLGRMFRYFLWDGVCIEINGTKVLPVDPLFLSGDAKYSGARLFEEPVEFELFVRPEEPKAGTSKVTVTFSELPVEHWQDLPNEKKRELGISNGAGVSVVRAGREVDFGWFFMGGKRRENYDDWWRCEVRFDPMLDEAFGITHTKQQIRPQAYLTEALQLHMETVARALNSRVRASHFNVKASKATLPAEELASQRDSRLKPLPVKSALRESGKQLEQLRRRNASMRTVKPHDKGRVSYRVIEDSMGDSGFYRPLLGKDEVVAVLNPKHGFHRKVYEPLVQGGRLAPHDAAKFLQLLILSAVRAEGSFTKKEEQKTIERFRLEWSEVLEVLLSGK